MSFLKDNYSYFQISYSLYSNSREIERLHGVSVTLLKGKKVTDQYPIYLESGANLSYFFSYQDMVADIFEEMENDDWWEDDNSWRKDRIQWFNISIPLNLSYVYEYNQDVSISPFVGPALRVNVLGKEIYEDEDGREEYNMFSKKDWEGLPIWRRVQLLGNLGLRINYKKLTFAYQYQGEFIGLRKWVKGYQNSFSVGVIL